MKNRKRNSYGKRPHSLFGQSLDSKIPFPHPIRERRKATPCGFLKWRKPFPPNDILWYHVISAIKSIKGKCDCRGVIEWIQNQMDSHVNWGNSYNNLNARIIIHHNKTARSNTVYVNLTWNGTTDNRQPTSPHKIFFCLPCLIGYPHTLFSRLL